MTGGPFSGMKSGLGGVAGDVGGPFSRWDRAELGLGDWVTGALLQECAGRTGGWGIAVRLSEIAQASLTS